jgi:hypothetical protein
MSSSDSSEVNESEASTQLVFVWLVKDEPILINKSQAPSVKAAKSAAMSRLINAYEKAFGKSITAEQVKKKLNIIKGEMKKKTEKKATGHKKIVLKLLDFKGENPSIHQIPGKYVIHFRIPACWL